MAAAAEALPVNTDFDPETGRLVEVSPAIARVTAPNAGPFTFTGTNTFLIGVDRLIVIDPGPASRRHFRALMAAIGKRPVEAILLTHTHRDHSGLARRLRTATNAPLLFNGRHRWSRPPRGLEASRLGRECDWTIEPDAVLGEGGTVSADGITVSAMATPGHCANHLCFTIDGTPYLFSGDHVMGWSSTMVAPPDGDMGDYLASLDNVIVAPFSHYLPAHGGEIVEGRRYARALLAHRQQRNRQVLEALEDRPLTIGGLVVRIYPGLKRTLRGAAAMTVKAHLEYLVARGEVTALTFGRYRRT